MKKAIGLSILSIIISVTALCIICVRNSELNIDWYGALIGVLSLLVTVLIGWNIYTVFDSNNRIDKLKRYVDEFRDRSNATINSLQMQTYMSLADFYRKSNVPHEYLIHSLLVVKHAINTDNINVANMYIEDINKQFPLNADMSNFHKAHVLRELFDLKLNYDISSLTGFDVLFFNINNNLA